MILSVSIFWYQPELRQLFLSSLLSMRRASPISQVPVGRLRVDRAQCSWQQREHSQRREEVNAACRPFL